MDPAIKSSTGQLAHNYLLRQRYRIIGVVGRGGFGAVYKARDTRAAGQLVAVKEMNRSGLSPQQIAEVTDTFKREALILTSRFCRQRQDGPNLAGRLNLLLCKHC